MDPDRRELLWKLTPWILGGLGLLAALMAGIAVGVIFFGWG